MRHEPGLAVTKTGDNNSKIINRGERAIQEEDGPIAENRQLAVGAASSAFGQWAFNLGPEAEGESTVQ